MPVYKRKIKNKVKYFAQVNFVDLNGSYKAKNSKYFDTKREAEAEEMMIRHQLLQPIQRSVTFDEVFQDYMQHQRDKVKETTLKKYTPLYNRVKDHIGDKRIEKFSIQQLKILKDYIGGMELTTCYKNKILEFLQALNKHSLKIFDIYTNAFDKVPKFKNEEIKTMNFYTKSEFDIFIDRVKDIKFKSFFITLYFLGLRLGEANALTWSDVKDDKIIIDKNITTKLKGIEYKILTPKTKNSKRVLPIPQEVKDALNTLKTHYMEFVNFSESWFVFGGITPLKDTTIAHVKDRAIKEAKLKHIRIHDFRHSCASYYINKGASILLVSKLLGHSNTSITLDTYSHLYPSQLEDLFKQD